MGLYKRERVNEVELNMQIKSAAMAECSNINQIFCSDIFFLFCYSLLFSFLPNLILFPEREREREREIETRRDKRTLYWNAHINHHWDIESLL